MKTSTTVFLSMLRRNVGVMISGMLAFGGAPTLRAQQSFGGQPLRSAGSSVAVPTFVVHPKDNVDDLRSTADWQEQQRAGTPLVVGRVLPIGVSIHKAAKLRDASEGRALYRLQIEASGASGMLLYYDHFYIPRGARLFISTADGKHTLGAFTHETNPSGGVFATDALPGEKLVIQYEPGESGEQAQIEISGVGYLFRSLPASQAEPATHPGEFSSDACHVNINCSEGASWQKERNGIVQIIQTAGDVITFCSGTVLNNTNEDFAPLVISAGHCRKGVKYDQSPAGKPCLASAEDFKKWIYRFHYYRPSCANNQYAERYAKTLVGAQMLAFMPIEGESDGLLVRLTKDIPSYYNVYYNGWNRSDVASPRGVGIHHPRGDAMKISSYTKPLETSQWPHVGAANAHWLCYFAGTPNGYGVTQSGSSGSALFGEDHLLTGTLSGGNSQCNMVTGRNYYGKLSYHWDRFKTQSDTSRMDIHLDPRTKGKAISLLGKYKPDHISLDQLRNLGAAFVAGKPTLSWQAAEASNPQVRIAISIEPFDETGKALPVIDKQVAANVSSFVDEGTDPKKASYVRYTVSMVYGSKDNERDVISRGRPTSIALPLSMPQGLLPKDLAIKANETGGVTLSWRKPTNYQIVSRMTAADGPTKTIGKLNYAIPAVNNYKTLYFGTRYEGSSFAGTKNTRLIGVRFVSARSSRIHSDKVYIRNGLEVHKDADGNYYPRPKEGKGVDSIAIPPDLLKPDQWSTFLFPHPYAVKAEEMLIVGLQITTQIDFAKDVISIDGKQLGDGSEIDNVFSFDGYRWMPISVALEGATSGSMALELILDDAPIDAPIPTNLPYGAVRSLSPALFPVVASYRLMRDGALLTELPATSEHMAYTDASGSHTSQYAVYPVYTDGSIATSVEGHIIQGAKPSVFPTLFDQGFNIRMAEEVMNATLYDLAGRQIMQIAPQSAYVRTEHLPSGQYILRITTRTGEEMSYKLYKQ